VPEPPAITDLAARLHEHLAARRAELLDDLATLVALESPSEDVAALNRTADWLEAWLAPVGRVTVLPGADGRRHLLLEPSGVRERSALLMCHYDTVWPLGTTAAWGFAIDGDVATGPGVFDMKASIVTARHALLALQELGLPCNARLLVTADEEIGNRTSRALIEAQAPRTVAALVLEPPLDDGRLKTERKGRGQARIAVRGRAAHAGVSPEAGINAIEELARLVLAVREVAGALPGVSATVGQIRGGTAVNVVPEHAEIEIDLRAWTAADLTELKARLEALGPYDPAAGVDVAVTIERPPMERMDAVDALLARCREAAGALGLTIAEGRTGGCSEGNFMAAVGVPTLDGLGVRGFGPHTREERIDLAHLLPQAALVGALAADLGADSA
jgi:glutamate carboxypeptidase